MIYLNWKMDWEDGQFTHADLIDHHNTKTESNQLQWKNSGQFEKSTDQEYYSQNQVLITTSQSLSITIQT